MTTTNAIIDHIERIVIDPPADYFLGVIAGAVDDALNEASYRIRSDLACSFDGQHPDTPLPEVHEMIDRYRASIGGMVARLDHEFVTLFHKIDDAQRGPFDTGAF